MSPDHTPPVLTTEAVDAALDYECHMRDWTHPSDLWSGKFSDRTPGDKLLGFDPLRHAGRSGYGTRPQYCLMILAAEVRRLRKTGATGAAATEVAT